MRTNPYLNMPNVLHSYIIISNLVTTAENASSTSFASSFESTWMTPSSRIFPIADTHASTTECKNRHIGEYKMNLYMICHDNGKLLKERVCQFFIGLSYAPKYDDLIDSLNPNIMTFKECSKRVQHMFNTLF